MTCTITLQATRQGCSFFTADLQRETTIRDSVVSFDLALGGGGEEAVQIQLPGQPVPGTLRIARWFGEALVVSGDKSLEEAVSLRERINAGEAHFFAESILKGLPEPLDA